MKILLIINSNDAEVRWNAIRFGNLCLDEGDTANIFLIGPGVEFYDGDSEKFSIKDESKKFILNGGTILGCTKCMDNHNICEDECIKKSYMKKLYDLVKEADKVINY